MKNPRSSANARGSSSSGPSSRVSITPNGTAGRLVGAQPVATRDAEVAPGPHDDLHEQLAVAAHRRPQRVAVVGAVVGGVARGARPGDAPEDPERRADLVPGRHPAALVVE